MKVNSVTGYKFNNNVDFTGKKSKTQQTQHTTNPMKAVPVIVLMAMSPLNAPVTNARPVASAQPQTEVVSKQRKVIASDNYPNPAPDDNVKCIINYISDDGDDDSIEKLQLVFSEMTNIRNKQNELSHRLSIVNAIDMSTLIKRIVKTVAEDGSVTKQNVYYVAGPGTKIVKSIDLDGNIMSRKSDEKDDLKVEITEQFYNDLKSVSDESIKLKEEFVVNDGIDVPNDFWY